MATTASLTTSPTTIDSGVSDNVSVTNTGTVDVTVVRGSQSFTLRPTQTRVIYPEGAAVTAAAVSGTGSVSYTAQAARQSAAQQYAADSAFTSTYARVGSHAAGGRYANPLSIPTPDGNANVGHPAIIAAPNDQQWSGYYYWMAFTPYPDANRENPCIAASNDGVTWVAPGTNPVAPLSQAVSDGYLNQSDPDLEFVTIGGVKTLVMIYRAQGSTANEGLFRRTSTDGVTWTARQNIGLTNASGSTLLSPSICLEADGTTLSMWTVKDTATPRPIERRQSTDGGLTWGSPSAVTYNAGGTTLNPWHMDVNLVNGRYYILLTDKVGKMFWQESADGLTWTGSYRPAVDKVQITQGSRGFYRATMLPVFGSRSVDGPSTLRWDIWATITDGTGADLFSDNWRIALLPATDTAKVGQPRLSMPAAQGRYVYPLGGTTTTGSYGGGTVRYVPILVDRYCPNGVEVHIEVTVVGSTGAQGRIGLYASGADGIPYGPALVDSLLTVDDAIGDHKVTYSTALPPGLYWGIYKAEGSPTTAATVRSIQGFVLGCPSLSAISTGTGGIVDSATLVSGSLPTVPSPASNAQSGLVFLKIL